MFNPASLQGIHNVFVVIPQFIVTGISAIIFAIFEPGSSLTDSREAIKTGAPLNNTLSSSSRANTEFHQIRGERAFDSIGAMFRYVLLQQSGVAGR
jgi:hypothetical protein